MTDYKLITQAGTEFFRATKWGPNTFEFATIAAKHAIDKGATTSIEIVEIVTLTEREQEILTDIKTEQRERNDPTNSRENPVFFPSLDYSKATAEKQGVLDALHAKGCIVLFPDLQVKITATGMDAI